MALQGWQLNAIKQNRTKKVWSVVSPIVPQGPTTVDGSGLTYDEAETVAVRVSVGAGGMRPWLRSQCNVVEILCNGEFVRMV